MRGKVADMTILRWLFWRYKLNYGVKNEPRRREVHEEENEERKEEILRMSKLIKILAINH